eukprot:TRINITY_DN55295_c0_g1_i1.p1 TRINITY_DN55295_c0_g1~~TRINITY_DN55295_c0_g1_i1.p1  ORF type:complete len:189 (+),score=33.19 TRINITY_DN55295_c0_g1_i1:96-662(+)
MQELFRERALLLAIAGFLPLAEVVTQFGAACSVFAAAARRTLDQHLAAHESLVAWAREEYDLRKRCHAEMRRWVLSGDSPLVIRVSAAGRLTDLEAGQEAAAAALSTLQLRLQGLRCAATALFEGVAGADLRRTPKMTGERREALQLVLAARETHRNADDAYFQLRLKEDTARALAAAGGAAIGPLCA